MRILMVNKFLYPRGGAETYMIYVAEQLIRCGHTVAFFGMEHLENTTLGESSTIRFIEFGSQKGFVTKAKSILTAGINALTNKVARQFNEFVELFDPDLIHAHNVYNQLPPSLFKKVHTSIPVIMTAHDYKPICPNYKLFVGGKSCTRCLTGSYYQCVKHKCCQGSILSSILAAVSSSLHRARKTYQNEYRLYIAPSHFMKERLIEGGIPEDMVRVIHNFCELPESITPPGEGILYCGRLSEEKGIETLLKSYAALPAPRPSLTIAGEGPLEKDLKMFCDRNRLNSVHWLGRISPNQVREQIVNCAVTVIPSVWFENCSMSIMESLAYGRPVIASTSGGNPELIEDMVTGAVFPANSTTDLSEKIMNLLEDQSLLNKMGCAARHSAEQRFSSEVHITQLLAVYKELIEEKFND